MDATGGDIGLILERIRLLDPQTVRTILIWAVLILLSADLLLFLITLVHRVVVDYRDRRYRRAYEKFTDQLIMAMYYGEAIDRPKGSVELEALGDVCIEISRKFKGEEGKFARKIARDYGVVDYYIRRTRSFFLATRVVYYEKLGYLKIFPIKKKLEVEIERTEAEWAIARMSYAYSLLIERVEEIDVVLHNLSRCSSVSFKFIEFVWYNIIAIFRERFFELDEYIRAYLISDSEKAIFLRAFIEAVGSYKLLEASELIMKVYEEYRDDTLMRISCVRALGNIGYEGFCQIFEENIKHEDWRVRAVVCRYAYLCPFERAIEDLKNLLSDSNYYVRINAGRAILFFRNRASSVLTELLNSEDRFVRDMAKYLLEELEVKSA